MTRLPLPYIHRFTTRKRGQVYVHHYFRRDSKRWRLPGVPGSPEFIAEYNRLLTSTAPKDAPDLPETRAGTMAALVAAWEKSADHRALAETTKTTYGRITARLVKDNGHRMVKDLTSVKVYELLDNRSATPAMANRFLSVLRLLMRFAVQRKWRDDDPTQTVTRVRYKKKGFPVWTDAELTMYETRWPIGTRERLAFELLLMTGQRRSDVIRMGPRDIRDGGIDVGQNKTGAELLVPIGVELQAAIDACQLVGTGTFLITQYGKPFASGTAFYNWFKDKSRAAGVEKPPHGLRKANQRIIAEQGGTTKQAMAVSGHLTLSEAERYQRAADQPTLARAGVAALSRGRKRDG